MVGASFFLGCLPHSILAEFVCHKEKFCNFAFGEHSQIYRQLQFIEHTLKILYEI